MLNNLGTRKDYQRYSRYKKTGIDWLGDIPGEWELKRARFLVNYKKGKKPDEKNESTAGLPYLSMEFLRGLEEATYFIQSEEDVVVKENDILLLWDGANAGEFVAGKRGILSSTMAVASLIKKESVIRYYFYYFKTFEKVLRELTVGMGIPHVSGKIIKDCQALIPNYNTQQSIADFLGQETGKIDRLIEKKQKLVELLCEKRTALISQAVTKGLDTNAKMKDSGVEWIGKIPQHWKILKMKRLSLVKRGASPRPIDDPKYFDDNGEYSWVRIEDVTASEHFLKQTVQRLSEEGKSLSVPLRPGDLFVSICASIGKPIITQIKCCIHDGFVYFPYCKEDRNFLYYVFTSGQPFFGLGKLGTQVNLNTETVGNIQIGLPPLKEQQTIAKFLDLETERIDKLMLAINDSIENLKEYRSALISEAVTGKIKV